MHVVQDQGHQALVGMGSFDRIVVAFRGSLSLQDWIDDLKNVNLTAYPQCEGCLVGDGWLDAVQSLQDDVHRFCKYACANTAIPLEDCYDYLPSFF